MVLKGSSGETDIENRLTDTGRGEERVRCMERVTWKVQFSSVQSLSHVQLFATPWTAAMPGFPVLHYFPEFV